MGLINAIMVPHPPLIIPQVGNGEEEKIKATIEAYEKAAAFIEDADPDTIIITTPHSIIYYDWFHISPGSSAKGSFSDFGQKDVKMSVNYDTQFVQELCIEAEKIGFPAGTQGEQNPRLDHAVMVPLYFLGKAYKERPLPPVVRIGLSGQPLTDHYRLGMMITEMSNRLNKRISVIASGDLSHKVKSEGPYGFSPQGPEYDEKIMDVMGHGNFGQLFDFSDTFCEAAAECGHRSFTIMAGCFDGRDVTSTRLSYEATFGVGYGVCTFTPGDINNERLFLEKELLREDEEIAARRANEDEYVRLARNTVETWVTTRRSPKMPDGLKEEMVREKAGVFVSLHINGRLRGCIGTTESTTDSIASEIIQNGISACSRDPRFPEVSKDELPHIEYSVDVLGAPEEINSPDELDVSKYGVIVSKGMKRGLLLPDLEGVDTVEEQIAIAKKKARLKENDDVRLQRFEVVRHE